MYNIEKEIQEITQSDIFMAVHENKGHCLTEHLLNDNELRQKLWVKKSAKDSADIIMATRFCSQEDALKLIQTTLFKYKNEIVKWRETLNYPYLEIQDVYERPTGEGIAKNTDYNRIFEVHGIRIVLVMGDSIGRAFYIKTAYPINTFEDNDDIYDAMDEWEEKRKRK